jgi:molybdenum cofactor guanylyltransferase
MQDLTGIILAGGKSSRLGSDKGLFEFNGKKLIEYPLNVLRKYCSELIISANDSNYEQFGEIVVADEIPDKGPVGGITSCLKKSTGNWNLVLACDMPFINQAFIDYLLENLEGHSGVVPFHHGWMEPLAAVYHKNLTALFSDALKNNDLSLYQIVQSSNIPLLPVENLLLEFPQLFSNFNTPSDLEKITTNSG